MTPPLLLRPMRALTASVLLSILAACATERAPEPRVPPRQAPPVQTPPPVTPQPRPSEPGPITGTALEQSLTLLGNPAAALADWGSDDARTLDTALTRSCAGLQRRTDTSGLTQPADWTSLCSALAVNNPQLDLKALLNAELLAVRVGDGRGLNTGYYEPELTGALIRDARFAVPLYRRPPELVDVDLGAFRPSLKGQRIAGRIDGSRLVPFADRAAIAQGALNERKLELAWVADEWEAFFLQVQGSGRVRLPDGQVMRVGYDGQNGQEYQSVGKILLQRGLLAKGQATMQGMLAWARANPDQARAIFNENKSYVFFKEVKGEGPLGALNVPLTPERSLAVDPLFVTLGAPVWLSSAHQDPAAPGGAQLPFSGLRVAQDTGGAIKGANRIDIFFGAGERAALLAGSQTATGTLTLLLPRASVERLQAAGRLGTATTPPAP